MRIRKAFAREHDEIYRMGFDVWGNGETLNNYLDSCRRSPKYQQGSWYVLEDETGTIYSSLIRYSFSTDTCGIGSVSTSPPLRNKGHGSMLILGALRLFEGEGINKIFLFSDIDPKFYQKLGFSALPRKHQHYKSAICMVRGIDIQSIAQEASFQPPRYF